MSFKSTCMAFNANANNLVSRCARVKYRSGDLRWAMSNGGAI